MMMMMMMMMMMNMNTIILIQKEKLAAKISIMITTTINVLPPNVVPICPTSTSTQLLVHPHGGVFPRIIDLEHWKNYLGLKCAIIHCLLWGKQLRQTWGTRVSQSDSSPIKKNSAGLRQIFEWGVCCFAASRYSSAAFGQPNKLHAESVTGHFVESFLDTFQFACPFSWGFTIISPFFCIFKIGVSPSSLQAPLPWYVRRRT